MTALRREPTPAELDFHRLRQEARGRIEAAAEAHKRRKMAAAVAALGQPVSVVAVAPPVSEPEAAAGQDDLPARPKNPFWFSLVEIGANPVTVQRIIELVCLEFGVKPGDLFGPRRTKRIVDIRQAAMWLCKDLIPERSYPSIGRKFGNRDHTTVLHACRAAPRKIAASDELRNGILKIHAALTGD